MATSNGRKKISLDKDSIKILLQEIYSELVEQRRTALKIQNKMLKLLNDAEDMQLIGPVIKEQQKIINDTIQKKMSLSKIQLEVWKKEKDGSKDNEQFSLNDFEDEELENLLKKADKTGEYER